MHLVDCRCRETCKWTSCLRTSRPPLEATGCGWPLHMLHSPTIHLCAVLTAISGPSLRRGYGETRVRRLGGWDGEKTVVSLSGTGINTHSIRNTETLEMGEE